MRPFELDAQTSPLMAMEMFIDKPGCLLPATDSQRGSLGWVVEQTAKRCITWLGLHCPSSHPLLSFVSKAQQLLLGHEAAPSKQSVFHIFSLSEIKVTVLVYLLFHGGGHSNQVLQGSRSGIYAWSRSLRGQGGFWSPSELYEPFLQVALTHLPCSCALVLEALFLPPAAESVTCTNLSV